MMEWLLLYCKTNSSPPTCSFTFTFPWQGILGNLATTFNYDKEVNLSGFQVKKTPNILEYSPADMAQVWKIYVQ